MIAMLATLPLALAGVSILQWLVIVIVVAAAIAIVYVVLKHFGITIPPVLVTIFWIVVVAAVAIIALKLLLGLVFV